MNKCDLDTLVRKRKDVREETHECPQSEGRQGTCARSIIAGVHFGEVSIDRSSLRWVISAVQTAMAHAV